MQGLSSYFLSILIAVLINSGCSETYLITESSSKLIPVDSTTINYMDTVVNNIIAPYRHEMKEQMMQIIGIADQEITADQPHFLGNTIAKGVLKIARENYKTGQIDFCILNNGGIRNNIPKGPILVQTIYEVLPFENELVVTHLSSFELGQMFDYIGTKGAQPISDIQLKYKGRNFTEATISNSELDNRKIYRVLTIDFLLKGGDGMLFFKNSERNDFLGITIRDAFIQYIKTENSQGKNIKSDNQKQIDID